jgi:hypothetical protein
MTQFCGALLCGVVQWARDCVHLACQIGVYQAGVDRQRVCFALLVSSACRICHGLLQLLSKCSQHCCEWLADPRVVSLISKLASDIIAL